MVRWTTPEERVTARIEKALAAQFQNGASPSLALDKAAATDYTAIAAFKLAMSGSLPLLIPPYPVIVKGEF